MDREITRDLGQKASDDAFAAIMRTCSLATGFDAVRSIYISACINLINSFISHLRESGTPEDRITILVQDIRESIDNLPEDKIMRN